MKEERRFKIDFYELSFLIEACIPKVPIARAMFWKDVIDKYYHQMTWDERARLHEWIGRNYSYENGLKNNDPDIIAFERRFNPDNQYKITTNYEGNIETKEAFLMDGKYHIKINTSILDEYITNVEKI
jgi:hypothetical protein